MESNPQYQGIRNMPKFTNDIREFPRWFYPEVKGISDIDAAYEKNGKVVIIEGKDCRSDGTLMLLFGQCRMLRVLGTQEKVKVLIVVGRKASTGKEYAILPIEEVNMKAFEKDDNGIWCQYMVLTHFLPEKEAKATLIRLMKEFTGEIKC